MYQDFLLIISKYGKTDEIQVNTFKVCQWSTQFTVTQLLGPKI